MNIDVRQVLLQMANTLVLFLVLRWLLFKPVTEFLNKRKATIQSTLDSASQKEADAHKLRAQYQQKLDEARDEARGIIEKANKQGQKQQDSIITEAKQQAQTLIERAKTDIALQQDQALAQLRDQVASIAVAAAGKVIEANIDEQAQLQLVDQFIERMDETHED